MAVNGYDEPRQGVQQFVDQLKLKQPVLLMGRAVGQDLYAVSGYPSSFWIDHHGKIVHREVGFNDAAFPAMEARLKRLLATAKKQAVETLGK